MAVERPAVLSEPQPERCQETNDSKTDNPALHNGTSGKAGLYSGAASHGVCHLMEEIGRTGQRISDGWRCGQHMGYAQNQARSAVIECQCRRRRSPDTRAAMASRTRLHRCPLHRIERLRSRSCELNPTPGARPHPQQSPDGSSFIREDNLAARRLPFDHRRNQIFQRRFAAMTGYGQFRRARSYHPDARPSVTRPSREIIAHARQNRHQRDCRTFRHSMLGFQVLPHQLNHGDHVFRLLQRRRDCLLLLLGSFVQ